MRRFLEGPGTQLVTGTRSGWRRRRRLAGSQRTVPWRRGNVRAYRAELDDSEARELAVKPERLVSNAGQLAHDCQLCFLMGCCCRALWLVGLVSILLWADAWLVGGSAQFDVWMTAHHVVQ